MKSARLGLGLGFVVNVCSKLMTTSQRSHPLTTHSNVRGLIISLEEGGNRDSRAAEITVVEGSERGIPRSHPKHVIVTS